MSHWWPEFDHTSTQTTIGKGNDSTVTSLMCSQPTRTCRARAQGSFGGGWKSKENWILLGRRKGQKWILDRHSTMSATALAPVTGVWTIRGEAEIMGIIMSSILDGLHVL